MNSLTKYTYILLILSMVLSFNTSLPPSSASAKQVKGFDLTDSLIPPELIMDGGPPRDGISSIDSPNFVDQSMAFHLYDNDMVLGIAINGKAKAYPIHILTHHEIVNDSLQGQYFAITYCPLCGSAIAFNTNWKTGYLQFGVSGLLYNSDLLLYDRNTESLWSQILGQAITGPFKGTKLPLLPVENTTWKDWRSRYPNGVVLSVGSRNSRYRFNPYPKYDTNNEIHFPVTYQSDLYHPKEKIIGLNANGLAKAYPFSELAKAKKPLKDVFNEKEIIIHFDQDNQSAYIDTTDGQRLTSKTMFWFAWYTFHPNTSVYQNIRN